MCVFCSHLFYILPILLPLFLKSNDGLRAEKKKKQIRILKRYYLITPMAMDLLCVCVTEEGDRKGRIMLLFQFTEAPLPTHTP